jgi:hypothetical protein
MSKGRKEYQPLDEVSYDDSECRKVGRRALCREKQQRGKKEEDVSGWKVNQRIERVREASIGFGK